MGGIAKTEERWVIANFRHSPEMWQSHSVIFYCLLPWALPTAITVRLNLLIAVLAVVLTSQKVNVLFS